ncbi:lipopolysaccharide assembly protein LapA domain-containing protein [Rhodococcus sp. Q]|uniref:lipopolysaccharide assembly protein LapA domain-containing protein n=1 Tax=Rhodococcus sp. Q TaxID=2502252 RepID=UPI0010F5336A|nr:lipopolysaccharide assembly protein LapA domain-containing protein [Rhodococcus sp. Q]
MSTTDGPNDGAGDPVERVNAPLADAEPPVPPNPVSSPETEAVRRHTSMGHTKAAATWSGLVIGVLVLIVLLVFILQNLDDVTLNLFWWEFSVPLGIGLLLAAIAGALIMALAGGVRIVQIRRLAKRAATR